jgi:hypothetical protein
MNTPHILSKNTSWLFDKAQTAAKYIYSHLKSETYKSITKDVRVFCLFVGYPRSGHSLVGSLLDAHPNSIIANELDALKFVSAGFNRDQIFYLLLRNSENHSKKGRSQTGYEYEVPNQWQGRTQRLLVLGDKKGGMTTQRLSNNPMLINQTRAMFGVPIKFIHVIRNPFDNITTMTTRTGSTILKEMIHYFGLCLKNTLILEIAGSENVLNIRHEDLIAAPKKTLAQIASFLGLEAEADYLSDCSSIIYSSPHKSREKHNWTGREKELILNQISRFSFLANYTFES